MLEELKSEVATGSTVSMHKKSETAKLNVVGNSPVGNDWLKNVLQTHPEIKELRERLKPLQRAASFAKIYNPGRKDVKERLAKDLVLQLIHQHLRAKGYQRTSQTLERESNVRCKKSYSGALNFQIPVQSN